MPEQAETVREIFNLFLSGMTIGDISRRLEAEGKLTGTGGSVWYFESIRTILRNMKYTGDVAANLRATNISASAAASDTGAEAKVAVADAIEALDLSGIDPNLDGTEVIAATATACSVGDAVPTALGTTVTCTVEVSMGGYTKTFTGVVSTLVA